MVKEMSEIKLVSTKTRLVMAGAIIVLLGLTLLGFRLVSQQYAPVDAGDKSYINVIIPENSTAGQIAAILEEHQLIHSKKVFLAYCRHNELDNQLKAGHYKFSRSQSLEAIARDISQGKVVSISFTIPEGYTVQQIGELLVQKNLCTAEAWNNAVQQDYDFSFLKEVADNSTAPLEGFLFPDTYFISEDTSAEQIVEIMLTRFARVWEENLAEQAQGKNISTYETVILASMIEREAMVKDERKIISGVIQNRLEKGMPLQIDATVLYCLGQYKDTVTYADLEVNSPYNTYQVGGIPPGPIACPGQAAIEAALNPDKHGYYYYVARGDGTHQFSKTYAEHLIAKKKYIK
ncbi:MAG: endolytic transglycosylase MltG [Syntrophomonadaceae bacterium]|nr:endolytic transglycosylase MltG [Syntrophomonadaceae bacterium]